jgi:hypothetical protein
MLTTNALKLEITFRLAMSLYLEVNWRANLSGQGLERHSLVLERTSWTIGESQLKRQELRSPFQVCFMLLACSILIYLKSFAAILITTLCGFFDTIIFQLNLLCHFGILQMAFLS